jgi:ADP-heptose:LPS heptosyltransferase
MLEAVRPLSAARSVLTHPVGVTRTVLETGRFLRAVLPALRRASGARILFQWHGGIGDAVCTFPAVLALRQKFPGAAIVYRVHPPLDTIVEMGRVADVVVTNCIGQAPLPRFCRALFDIELEPFLEDERPTGMTPVHLVDEFCLKAGVTPTDRQPRLTVPPGLADRVLSQLFPAPDEHRPLIAIHTEPNWKVREWSDAGWQELVSWLVNERHAHIIQLGGGAVYRNGHAVKVTRIEGALDCVGRFSLEETAACVQACDLLIGVDSALLHIAGAVGTPCVGLFGSVNPALRLPPQTPSIGVVGDVPCLACQHRTPIMHWQDDCPMHIMCMKVLTVAQVAEACDRMLGQRPLKCAVNSLSELRLV